MEIVQSDVEADAGIEQCTQLVHGRKRGPCISVITIDKNKPTVAREWREQPEPIPPYNDAAAFGRAWQTNFHVGDDKSTVVGLSIEMLLHRMARHTVGTARAQNVSRGEDLRSAPSFERYTQAGRVIFDRLHFLAVFNLDAKAFQMFAQDCLGAPLRQAALKFVFAPDIREFRGRDLLQTRAEQLNFPDAHARAKERLDQAAPVNNLQHCGLQRGPASLAVRRQSALDDARLDPMPQEFAGRE